jgi:hypothetical protein
VAHWHEYTLKVLDRFGNTDDTFPELPGVRSKVQLEAGATVAIAFAFGGVEPTIIGRWSCDGSQRYRHQTHR